MKILSLLPLSILSSFLLLSAPSYAQDLNAPAAPNKNPIHSTSLLPFVELYTSQSCPRCPKANERFADFASTHDVIAVTFPVGIWDFMGWKDSFAEKTFSDRHEAMNVQLERRGPYTPQTIFNGKKHCSAVKEKNMERRLEEVANTPNPMSVQYDGNQLNVTGNVSELEIWVVDFIPGKTYATPTSGQNSNKTMVYHNRVTDLVSAGILPAKGGKLSANCIDSCAIIFQHPNHGEVLGAITYPDNSGFENNT